MKFGRTLREKTLREWRFYAVDYKALKKTLKQSPPNAQEFYTTLESSKEKLSQFHDEKLSWASDYVCTLEERVQIFVKSFSPNGSDTVNCAEDGLTLQTSSNSSAVEEDSAGNISTRITEYPPVLNNTTSSMKEKCQQIETSHHFQNFIYAKKSLSTFDRELDLLIEFFDLNKTAFSKIIKKFDKRTGEVTRDESMKDLLQAYSFLNRTDENNDFARFKEIITEMMNRVNALKPTLPEGWEDRKVYTIGCFDLFNRGHQNVLLSLREFGYFVVVGLFSDELYSDLKNERTIENIETRMRNVKPLVDQLFVIPAMEMTPLLYVQGVVSDQDIETGSCCFVRVDDMPHFPGRDWIESVMPVHYLPSTEL